MNLKADGKEKKENNTTESIMVVVKDLTAIGWVLTFVETNCLTQTILYIPKVLSAYGDQPRKSFEVNINLFEYSFGSSYFGLVTD